MADKKSPSLAKANTNEYAKQQEVKRKSRQESRKEIKSQSPRARKRKRRFELTEKLPTPPPDPRDLGERLPKRKSLEENKENEGVQREERHEESGEDPEAGSATSQAYAAAFIGTDEAFQHLDKLHLLMEQILELREKNAKLFKRVRELERCKALRKLEARNASLQDDAADELYLPYEDVGFAESLLSAMLESFASSSSSNQSAAPSSQEIARVRSFRSSMQTRQRSRSIGTESSAFLLPNSASKRSSCHFQHNGAGAANSVAKANKRNSLVVVTPKVSKWTKVKAAFKWEKAGVGSPGSGSALSSVVTEAMDQDATKFLRLPELQDTAATTTTTTTTTTITMTTTTTPSGSSPRTADHSDPPSPATLSSSSSTDDVFRGLHKRAHGARSTLRETEDLIRRRRSLDSELIIPQNIQFATQNLRDGISKRLEKGHKTPWGMVKDILHPRRDNVRRPLPRGSIRSEDGYSVSSLESSDIFHEILASDTSSSKPRVQITAAEGSLTVPSSSSKPPSSPGASSEIVDLASRRLTPTLTITVPSNEELRSVSSPESTSPPRQQHQHQHQQHLDCSQDEDRSTTEDRDSTSSPSRARSAASASTTLKERRRSAALLMQSAPIKLQRQDSKWNKVKRAFLSGANSVPQSPSRISSFFDETTTDCGGSYSASAEDLDNNNGGGVSPTTQTDIQRNYQILHDKLSVEFNRKLAEWEKMKSSQSSDSRSSRTTATTSPKDKDSANVLLMGEEQLTPEFKKKLQEWKRIKKGSSGGGSSNNPSGTTSPEHQLFRRRLTDWQIWRAPTKTEGNKTNDAGESAGRSHLSEDFLKKMEEWKKIKSGRSDEEQSNSGRRNSVELISQVQNFDQRWKTLDEKEFQPLDKVIAMIDREQKMVESQKEKLLDKKLRLRELSRVLDSTPTKKEVLIHTSTGFYRFEGISQEFTRKLYEWEKSQGIGPESSTFQLLNPAYRISKSDKRIKSIGEKCSKTLKRSKSMSSVFETSQRVEAPIRQPSSLSLNDVTNLENEDSKQTIGDEEMSEELLLDDSEPEAVIVDIEDVVEETASPMARLQPQQTPVYCVTASETTSIAIPLGTVTASHDSSPVLFMQAGETHHIEHNYETLSEHMNSIPLLETLENIDIPNDENRRRLFDPSDIKICETIIEEDMPSSPIGEGSSSDIELLNNPHKIDSKDIGLSLQEKLRNDPLKYKNGLNVEETQTCGMSTRKTLFPEEHKSTESEETVKEFPMRDDEIKEGTHDALNQAAEDLKVEEVNDSVITVNSDIRQKKVLKTRRLTDTQVGYKWRSHDADENNRDLIDDQPLTVSTFSETPSVERIIINESTLNKIIVPTANSNEHLANIATSKDSTSTQSNDSFTTFEETCSRRLNTKSESKSVFVKTKRIIFSPFSRRNTKGKNTPPAQPNNETLQFPEAIKESKEVPTSSLTNSALVNIFENAKSSTLTSLNIQRSRSSTECPTSVVFEKRPPLPQSPILSRKEYHRSSPKETAPSIRMMIQRYNQKLQEESAGSPASSGSGSPIWRSPTSERRVVKTQMEKYQEEVRRVIAGSSARNDVSDKIKLEKSASAGVIPSPLARKCIRNEILKSTSVDFAKKKNFIENESNQVASSDDKKNLDRTEFDIVVPEKRRGSLQNKNPEIYSNIKQSLVQEYKTLPIRNDSIEDKIKNGLDDSSECSIEVMIEAGKNVEKGKIPERISPDLMHKLNALSNAALIKYGRFSTQAEIYDSQVTASENSTPLQRIRAQRIQQAKNDFFSRESSHSHDASIESSHRLSQNSSTSIDLMIGKSDFVKSASAGMINVDPRTFERLATRSSFSNDCSQTLPRTEKTYTEVSGTLSKIASKFRRTKLKRGKDKDGKMSTVSMLCRQSLLVDIQGEEVSKSCPTSPSTPHRDEDEHSRIKQHRETN